MVRNVSMTVVAVFLAFAVGTFTQETLAATSEVAVSHTHAVTPVDVATPTDATIVAAPVEVTLAATPTEVTVTAAADVTATTGEASAWANITSGLWLILAGVAALVAIWWKKRKLAANNPGSSKP